MAILFVGSSPSDLGGATTPYTGVEDVRDPDFTPVSSVIPWASVGGNAAAAFAINFASSNDVWIHFRTKWEGGLLNTNSDGYLWRMFSGGDEIIRVNMSNIDPNLLDSAGGTATYPAFTYNTTQTFDIHVVDNGATFTIDVYVGGALQSTHTWTDASVGVTRMVFDHYDFEGFTTDFHYSEFIVTDAESTIGWRLATLDAAADGFHTDWAGDFNGVTELGDGLSISSDTANQRQSWTLSTYNGPATASGVRAVVNKIIGDVGATGPQTLVPSLRIGGTDYDQTGYTADGSAYLAVIDDDPATAATWNTSALATLEVGLKSEA